MKNDIQYLCKTKVRKSINQVGRSLLWVVVSIILISPGFTRADTIRGTITNGGVGIEGYGIVAVQEVRIGYKIGRKPCRSSHPNFQTIGTAETGIDGSFTIDYTAAQNPPGSCAFSAKVYIKVFKGANLVWTSPKVLARNQVTINHELNPVFGARCGDSPGDNTFDIYLSVEGCDSNIGTNIEEPIRTLSRAYEIVDFKRGLDHIIYVRGGIYYGESIIWRTEDSERRKISPEFCLTIAAYGDEKPIFEGVGHSVFIDLRSDNGECTNVTIKGLTIRHYVNYGIRFYGDKKNRPGWNGCNTIIENTFEEIGNLYNTDYCIGCQGFGAIDLVNSDRNIIRDNIFVNSEDTEKDAAHMHAVYFAHNSSENQVFDNYVSITSGDPFRVRDASNNNNIHNNYVDRSGKYGFISGFSAPELDETVSNDNVIKDNVITFPYPLFSSVQLIHNTGQTDASTFIDDGQKFFRSGRPNSENIGAMASGDFNGDGKSELVVAFNYNDFVKVVRTTGGPDRYLQKIIYLSTDYEVHGFATGDFDESGTEQILTFFRHKSTGRTDIYRGNGITSLTNYGRIYNSTRWDVTAMTAGDFDGDGKNESVVALRDGNETRLYRGNGTSSVLNLGNFYTSTKWNIPALTVGNFDSDDKDELISALHSDSETRIYRGNGTSSALNYDYFYSSTVWNIPALTAGVYRSDDGPQIGLVTAFIHKNNSEVRLYRGNGVTSATNKVFYTSKKSDYDDVIVKWKIAGLVSGQFDNSSSSEEIVTAFTWSSRNQIFAGDGWKTATVLSRTIKNIFHRWTAP